MRTRRPPGRTSSTACSTAAPVPAVSTSRSTPSRPEKLRATSGARGGELVGAELAGQALASIGATDGQDCEPPRLQQLDGEETQRPHAEHGRALAAPGLAATDGAHHHGQRLGEHELIVVDGGGRRPAAARGQPRLLGEPAVHVDADGRAREAEVAVAFPAERAVAARVVRLHRDLLPGPDIADVAPHRHHLADELVTHDARVVDGSVSVPDPVVGAAEARGEHAHDGLAGTGRRLRALLDPHVPGPAEDGGVHGAHPSGTPHSRQARPAPSGQPAVWPPSRKTVWPVM